MGNLINLMQIMGHYDAQAKICVKKVEGGGTLKKDMTKVEMLLMELGYRVQRLEK